MYKTLNLSNYNTQPLHNYQTRNQYSLYIPRPNLTLFKHSTMYIGPKIWNYLPGDIKQSESISLQNKIKESFVIRLLVIHMLYACYMLYVIC